jgi:hypothetical protein
MASLGQASAHFPQAMHFMSRTMSWGKGSMDSGLEHQSHRRGHPLKKTVVRIPGPSWMLKRWMLKTNALSGLPLRISDCGLRIGFPSFAIWRPANLFPEFGVLK